MSVDLWISLLFSLTVYLAVWSAEKWVFPLFRPKVNPLTEMTEAELRSYIVEVERRLSDSEKKNKELEANQALLLRQLGNASSQIARQEEKIKELSDKVRELSRSNPIAPIEVKPMTGRILGVWPESSGMDIAGERKAILDSGLEFDALQGEKATRMGIVEQLAMRDYKIMEIGARGGAVGIKLYDGIATPEWWLKLARQHNIEIFVVLANESSKPGVENVADALFNAGAKAVVSVDSEISDAEAVKFATTLYRRLGRGVPLAKAVEYAKLAMTDAGSNTIKLREAT